MGNTSAKPYPRPRNKKVHWKAADHPSKPGKPELVPEHEGTPDVLTIRWGRPVKDGGSPVVGYLVEHRRFGSPHWVRATPLLVPFPELTLSGLEPGWRYQFRVSAENAVGLSDPSDLSDPLTVTLQRSAITTPRFTQDLIDMTSLENDKIEFVVYFMGQPHPKICWFKDGFEIFSSRRIRILTESDRSVLTIHQCQLQDAGEIKCTATNKAGHCSTKAILTLEAAPSIRLPRQYEEGLLFEIGEVIRLKVSIAGLPPPLVFWSHNGESLQTNERYELENYENTATLRISEASRSDRGEYHIKAVNKLGQDSTSFLVTVTDKPASPGKARVVMTLGKSVTLAWNTPEDDGGCKIGNYIVEYYRLGWDVWLKAATSRQLSTVLGDLIEGSQYKFRVKAESPYGISDPSEESEAVFIPDPKRGITEPRSLSQPREIPNLQNETPTLPMRKKPRSQSSTRAETHHVQFKTPNDEAPVRPERTKPKTPQRTPEPSPRMNRREFNKETFNKALYDRASMNRDLAYGTPDFKIRKTDVPQSIERPTSSNKFESKVTIQYNTVRSRTPSPYSRPEETINQTERSPSPSQPKPREELRRGSEHTRRQPERSPSPNRTKTKEDTRRLSNYSEQSNKEDLRTGSEYIRRQPKRSPSPNRIKPKEELRCGSEHIRNQPERSPSPNQIKPKEELRRLSSPNFLKCRSPSPNTDRKDFSGSAEFMVVLFPDEHKHDNGIEFHFDDNPIPPPLSLSAPELGAEPPTFEGLKYSASSSELLHERAMMRFYEAALAEEAASKKKDERRSSIIPKIQINDRNEEEIALERKLSRRRYSAGVNLQQQVIWAQRRQSLRNSGDLQEILESKLHRFPLTPEEKREIMMNRKRSQSEEKEEEEFEKIRARMAQRPKLSKKKSIDVVDLEKWDEYNESEEEYSDERLYDEVPMVRSAEEEDVTYNPFMRSQNRKEHEPFEILTKPNKLPDPNFKPKPILKKNNDEDGNGISSSSRSVSMSPPMSPDPTDQPGNIDLSKRGSLPWSIPATTTRRGSSQAMQSTPFQTVSAIASISGFAAAGVVIPQPLLSKRKYEEEAKVVIDHYADIVKSHSRKTKVDSSSENISKESSREKIFDNKRQSQDSSIEKLNGTRSRHNSSSSSQRSSSPTKTRMRRGSPTVLNKDLPSFRTSPKDAKAKRTRTPSKSPGRLRKTDPSPQRTRNLSVSSVETTSLSTQTSIDRRSPSPVRLKPPKMKEIMTQTSTCIDNLISQTAEKLSASISRPKDIDLSVQKKVRSTIDYTTDVAMFIVACWLYLFNNELLAIPVMLVMVYRQLQDEVKKRIPKWMMPKPKK